jgi:hypothetical protein
MHWLYNDFEPYCQRIGLKLLKDDMKFIKKMLSYIPCNEHKRLLTQYILIWRDSMAECKNSLSAMNLGRRNANIYLREYVNAKR